MMRRRGIENFLMDSNTRFKVIHEHNIVQSVSATSRLILRTNCEPLVACEEAFRFV